MNDCTATQNKQSTENISEFKNGAHCFKKNCRYLRIPIAIHFFSANNHLPERLNVRYRLNA